MANRGNDSDDASGGNPAVDFHAARRSPSTQPPRSTDRPIPDAPVSRRDRMRDLSRRTNTLKIRPWSQLPGVVAYVVVDADGQITDAWGETVSESLARAATFRDRVGRGQFDGSHLLETCVEGRRLLSVSRSDGWFVHVWLEGATDVVGILAVVGG